MINRRTTSTMQGYTRKTARYNLEPHSIKPTARINKYRPARSKQSGTRKEKYRTLSKTYRTALRDKFTAHNRVIKPQPIARGSGDTLNRIGRNRAGSHRGTRAHRGTFKQDGSRRTQSQSYGYFYTDDAAIAKYRTL